MRIGILEDDRSHAFVLQRCLIEAGHVPQRYERGADILKAVETDDLDALLLDWNVPDLSGIEVLNRVRQQLKSSIPIVLITARTSEDDVVQALRQGADDYMSKPVGNKELLARLESVTRRTRQSRPRQESIESGRLRVDIPARRIYVDGRPAELSAKDFDLAVLLLRNVGRLFSRSQISEAVWGGKAVMKSRTLDTHVSHVRTRLCLSEANGWRLSAVYGRGYRLERFAHYRASRS